jgi:uncharacterized membrane protein YcfT
MGTASGAAADRVDWVDYAKGFCIIFVVMMHSTVGVQDDLGAYGWLDVLVEWARPFRIPAFFLVSGLFLSRTIERGWRTYLDRKVIHFAYFYILWLTIEFAFKGPFMAREAGWGHVGLHYAWSYVDPFGPLWFIYLLPIFFIVTKLVRSIPAGVVLAAGAGLTLTEPEWSVAEHFSACFVFFYAGYVAAPHVFRFAEWARTRPRPVLQALVLWAVVHFWLVFGGYSLRPGMYLVLGFVGAAALVAGSALMTRTRWLAPVRYCGEHSIVIYLAFFIPMAMTRILLIKTGVVRDIGTISAIVTVAAVTGPLALYWLVRRTPLRVLFERPRWFSLAPRARTVPLAPAAPADSPSV